MVPGGGRSGGGFARGALRFPARCRCFGPERGPGPAGGRPEASGVESAGRPGGGGPRFARRTGRGRREGHEPRLRRLRARLDACPAPTGQRGGRAVSRGGGVAGRPGRRLGAPARRRRGGRRSPGLSAARREPGRADPGRYARPRGVGVGAGPSGGLRHRVGRRAPDLHLPGRPSEHGPNPVRKHRPIPCLGPTAEPGGCFRGPIAVPRRLSSFRSLD